MRITSFIAALSAATVLAGCASRPSSAPVLAPGGVEPPVASAATPRAALVGEQRRLADLFRGTPVVFVMQGDGALRVGVPLRYSFDKGRHAVKPPLGAVLDRVAKSQSGESTRLVVMAPPDPGSKAGSLATERGTSVRDYLVQRGIDAPRLSLAPATTEDLVIVVSASPM